MHAHISLASMCVLVNGYHKAITDDKLDFVVAVDLTIMLVAACILFVTFICCHAPCIICHAGENPEAGLPPIAPPNSDGSQGELHVIS